MRVKEKLNRFFLKIRRLLDQEKPLLWRNLPANFNSQDNSPEALQKDAEYAYKIGRGYLTVLNEVGLSLNGLRIVEFGPGCNFGTALYLACHGARMAVADRFLSLWRNHYHLAFYRKFFDYLKEKEPGLNLDPLRQVLNKRGYPPDVLTQYTNSLEDMVHLPAGFFDVTLSNAVLEHLYDVKQAFVQLSRLTKDGGVGLHQVDHRDHRDFSRPLEYLLLSDLKFKEIFTERHGECGNRMRPLEMEKLFEDCGFEVLKCSENMTLSPDYLKDFFPRLQQARDSAFYELKREELICISCQYIVRKKF